ncbi:hypothetical protein M2137_001154 [Parabacteroides sp. PFB2-10]|nr:hypothetical protein [Parabacteroides sp. PFB2-10]
MPLTFRVGIPAKKILYIYLSYFFDRTANVFEINNRKKRQSGFISGQTKKN